MRGAKLRGNKATEKMLCEKPVNGGIRSGEIISEDMSRSSSANLKQLVLPQASAQPVLPQDPAGKHGSQNQLRPARISPNKEIGKSRGVLSCSGVLFVL